MGRILGENQREEYAAYREEREVERIIGSDWLIYQELSDLIEACREGNERIERFDTSCFSGEYITGVQDGYLEKLQLQRSDQAKSRRRLQSSVQLAS